MSWISSKGVLPPLTFDRVEERVKDPGRVGVGMLVKQKGASGEVGAELSFF